MAPASASCAFSGGCAPSDQSVSVTAHLDRGGRLLSLSCRVSASVAPNSRLGKYLARPRAAHRQGASGLESASLEL